MADTELPRFSIEKVNVMIHPGAAGKAKPRDLLQVICPRCKGGFFVGRQRWAKSEFTTRPCPYCFKVSLK